MPLDQNPCLEPQTDSLKIMSPDFHFQMLDHCHLGRRCSMVRLCLLSTFHEYVGSVRWRCLCLNLSACQFLCLHNTTANQNRVTGESSIGERSGSIATLSGVAPGGLSTGVDKTYKNTASSSIARPGDNHPPSSVYSCNQQHRPHAFSIFRKHVLKH
jgi:hypothetical protein